MTMMKSISGRRAFFAGALLLCVPALIVAKGTEIRLRTPLAGGSIEGLKPSGSAEYRTILSEGRARLNVQVEDVNLPAGTQVDVFVDGAQAGSIAISAAPIRGGELDLNSQDSDAVPSVKKGSVVVVKNAGTAILSGVLN